MNLHNKKFFVHFFYDRELLLALFIQQKIELHYAIIKIALKRE